MRGRAGGWIFSSSEIATDSVSFRSCRAQASGAIDVRSGDPSDVKTTMCLFLNEQAGLFGILLCMSEGGFVVDSCNMTRASTTGRCACAC
jgi:hypothetical protein